MSGRKKGCGPGSRGKRAAPLVLIASQRVTPQQLPINPAAGAAGRYKMPQLVCISSGKNQNTRVSLDNLNDVAAALERPPGYIVRYIQYAASVKSAAKDHSLRIDPKRLEPLLQSFIEEWVLCIGCGLPECELLVPLGGSGAKRAAEDEPLLLKCSACGYCGEQSSGIMSRQAKLVKYMRANPPSTRGGTQQIGPGIAAAEEAIAAAEAQRRTTTSGAGSGGSGERHEDDDSSSVDSDSDSSGDAPAADLFVATSSMLTSPPVPVVPLPEPEPVVEFEPLPMPSVVYMEDATADAGTMRLNIIGNEIINDVGKSESCMVSK